MLKKSLLLTIAFIFTISMMTGCNSSKTNKKAQEVKPVQQVEKVDYIVTTTLPTQSREGIKDSASPKFVKINPNFQQQGSYPKSATPHKWFTTGLGSKIPAFKGGDLLEVINTDNAFVAYIANVDEKLFKDYFDLLCTKGYHFADTSWESMLLYNDKYEINMRYSQDGATVTTLRARIYTPEESAQAKQKIEKEIAKSNTITQDKPKTETAKTEKK